VAAGTPAGTPSLQTAPKYGTLIPNRIFVGGIAGNASERPPGFEPVQQSELGCGKQGREGKKGRRDAVQPIYPHRHLTTGYLMFQNFGSLKLTSVQRS